MGTKALEEYVNGLPAGDYDAVNQSVRRGFQRNPDAYAKSLDLAKKTGVAPELQEGMEQDIDLEARVGQVPIQKIVQSHPALAKHLKDDGFATLAQNDLRSLLGLSAAVQAIPEMKPWNPTFADKTKDFFRGLMEGTTFSTPEEAQAIRQAESARILTAAHMGVNPAEMHTGNAATLPASRIGAGLLRGALRPLSGAVRYAERKTGIDTGIGANLQGGVEALTPASPTTADTSVESFGSTLGLLVPGLGMQKAVGAISKVRALAKVPALIRQAGQWAGAVAMALPEAASEAQDVYDELKAKGSTDQEASSMSDRTFWGNAAMLAVTDKIGWFSGEGLTRRVVAEAAQEGTQTGMSNAATGKPILENVPESALMGGATAGVMHVGGKFVSGLLGKQTTGAIDFSEKVQDTQEFLADLSEGVKASKIAETSPDRVQAFVQDAAKDGQENLLIPADRYFQTVTDAGLDPAELAQSLGVVNLQEAMEAGTDVVIPVGAYAAQIAATDLHGKLAQDIRLNPGDATMREEQEAGKLAEDEAAKTTEDAQGIQVQSEIDALSTSSELDKYRESVKQAMIGGNIPADQAADLAEAWIQPARVFIEQGDITAEQAAQMWPLTVSAYRKGEGKKSIAQIALDRLKAMGAGVKEYAQSVFHGSPYRFDKFSLEHMGKGEGAQAYGHGLYFAGSRDVAEYYRQGLSGGSRGGLSLAGVVPSSANESLSDGAWVAAKELSELLVSDTGVAQPFSSLDIKEQGRVLSVMKRIIEDDKVLDAVVRLVPVDVVNVLGGKQYPSDYLLNHPTMLVYLLPADANNLVPGAVEAIDKLAPSVALAAAKVHTRLGRFDVSPGDFGPTVGTSGQDVTSSLYSKIPHPSEFVKGQLYQVDIPDDGAYLLWDKPLSEQPEAVTKAIVDKLADSLPAKFVDGKYSFSLKDITGGELVKHMTRTMGDRKASMVMNQHGIAGIKYQDGNSRGQWTVSLKTRGEDYSSTSFATQAQAEEYAAEKKREGFETSVELGGNYNYVVFDDNAVKIMQTFYQRGGGRYASDKEARAARARRAGQNTQASMDKAKTDVHNVEEAEFTAFDSAVKELQAGDILSDKRGFIQVTPDRQFHIGLLEGRDLSTFLHESGHYFLEVMGDLAERPEASERVKGMWADTLKSFGVDVRSDITTEHHEQFARQMERYLMEGKAPSEKLRPMFQRFKSWLMLVYKQMDKIGVRINDDVRSVFDRLMATDAEIEAHRPQVETFATAKDMGVSQKEFEIYQKAKAGAMEEGRDRLQVEVMKDLLREQKAAYKAEKAVARAEVEAGVDSRPDMKAMAALSDPGNSIKLNRQAVQDQFGDARGLPVVEEGGMDAEAAAEMLGFDSGAQLYQALKDAPARADLIDTLTDEIMFSRYGDVTLDGSIADKAVEALHNDKQADVEAMELRAMDRLRNISEKIVSAKNRQDRAAQSAARKSLPTTNSARLAAQAFVSNMSLREMEPNKYDIAERKYLKEAAKLTKKKDYEGAVAAQSRALLNHFLYREAKKGQEEDGKIREYAKKGTSTTFQAMLGHAGQEFQDGFNQVLDGYEIAKVPNWELDERKAALLKLMDSYGDDENGEGGGIAFDPMLIERTPKNYKEVPLSELRAVKDALKNIETVARLQLEADINGKKVEFGEIRSIFTNWTPEGENTPVYMEGDSATTLEKAGHLVRGLDAILLKVEWMVDRFDRGDINGPMRTFIKHLVDTSVGKRQDMGYEIHSKLEALAKARDPKHVAKMNDTTTVMFPLRKKPMTYQQITAWALNLGTIENKRKALLGEGLIDGEGTVSPVVDQALSLLPASELRFIQGVWDTLEILRQPLADEYRRKTGLTMTLKELTPLTVTSSDGETINLRGGYYPLAGSHITNVGKDQADPLSRQGQGRKAGPKVATGMTVKVTDATYQLKLDFSEVLSKHLSDTITNITFGETSQTVNKILNDEDISKALSEKLGKEYVDTLKGWLTDVLERPGDAPPMDPAIKAITEFKSGACVATLAGSVPSVLVQISDTVKPFFAPGISNLQLVKARYDMCIHHAELIAKIKELSPNVMRHRAENYNREIRDTLTSYGAFDTKSRATAEYLMSAFAAMDREITFPTWLAVYRKGMATHNNEAQAVMEADRIVSRTFQAGDPNNMSQMFRSRNGWQRLFTTFQNDGNTWYGIISSAVASKDVGRVSMALMGAFIGQALGQMLKNRGWGDDDDDKKEWVIKQAWLTPIGSLPVVGGALDTAMGVSGFGGGGDFTTSVMGRTIKGFAKPFVEWHKNGWDGIDWEDVAIAEAEAVGTVKGIPGVSQAIRSWKYVHKVRTGEETPDGALDFAANTVFGKNPNKK